eukprot:4196748-Amphidinium_carterae.1
MAAAYRTVLSKAPHSTHRCSGAFVKRWLQKLREVLLVEHDRCDVLLFGEHFAGWPQRAAGEGIFVPTASIINYPCTLQGKKWPGSVRVSAGAAAWKLSKLGRQHQWTAHLTFGFMSFAFEVCTASLLTDCFWATTA